jgi:hypothetical protein
VFPSPERRGNARLPCGQAAFCRTHQPRDYIFWTAQARDISTAGIRLVLGHRFEPGTMLAVELLSPSQSIAREIEARVVHTTDLGESSWSIGCEFANRLSEAELASLL